MQHHLLPGEIGEVVEAEGIRVDPGFDRGLVSIDEAKMEFSQKKKGIGRFSVQV